MTRFLAALAHACACSPFTPGAPPCTWVDYVLGLLIVIAAGALIVGCIAAVIWLLGFPIGPLLRKYGQTWAVIGALGLAGTVL
ncbi:hypothetical protein ABIE45_004517 [Methylobacterium sp. OAE515]|uniref:hypothetical protein n=1 Tax=Methylobacterium sp. OAE515 TaxID=2817895 RepID=UPI0017895637